MIIKKYQAGTETQAIMLAKEDLGKDAIVMNIKTIKPKGLFKIFRKTQVEVTAAIDESRETEKKVESKSTEQFNSQISEKLHPEQKKEDEETKALNEKLNSLARLLEEQIEQQKKEENLSDKKVTTQQKEQEVSGKKKDGKTETSSESVTEKKEEKVSRDSIRNKSIDLIMEQLTGNEVSYTYAKQIVEEITHTGNVRTLDEMLSGVYQKIILKLGQVQPITMEKEDKKPKIVLFIGPTGVGKTTTIAKLSSKLILEQKKKIAILTADTYRISAVEQIKTYASILSIPVEVLYEKEEVEKILPKYKDYDYILVDTAGRSHKNKDRMDDLKEFMEGFSQYSISVYLVLSATTKYKDLKKIVALYEDISECNLIFTKLDETDAIGNILNIKLDTGMPLSYISYGQNVPDDIEIMNPQVIAKQVLGGGDGYGSGR
ncbi:MAG: flagellar biosynthesis protein FlhF [Clostridiales bacterium]|nr:flagellar biosynthesis protein FlhF [Clostridiales bacterium]